jgi:hypothetical protein
MRVRLAKIAGVLSVTAIALYACYLWAFPSVTLHYRLTLVVNIDGQPVEGSSVIEVTRQDTKKVFGSMGGVGASIKGQAVVVDLGKNGKLFAILHGREPYVAEDQTFPSYVLFSAFAPLLDKNADGLSQLRVLKARHPKTAISSSLIPMLVRFRNIVDPMTVEVVDPDNLQASFGPGVILKTATIEITDDPVSTGIDKVLPWLQGLNGRYLGGFFTSKDAPLGLHAGNFQL